MTEAKPKAETKKFVEDPIDFQDYQKFGELKFLMWGDHGFEEKRLKEKTLKEFHKLEKKFKDYPGKKPKVSKTIFLGIGIDNARIVEGYGVPESLYKKFKEAGKTEIYF